MKTPHLGKNNLEEHIMETYEYKLPKELYKAILKTRNEKEKKENPYAYAARYVDEHFGLLRKVTRVIVE